MYVYIYMYMYILRICICIYTQHTYTIYTSDADLIRMEYRSQQSFAFRVSCCRFQLSASRAICVIKWNARCIALFNRPVPFTLFPRTRELDDI